MWHWLKRKLSRQSSRHSRQGNNPHDNPSSLFSSLTILQLLQALWNQTRPHVYDTLFFTGAFLMAWAWDLVVYAISHVQAGQSPLHNQLAFAVTDNTPLVQSSLPMQGGGPTSTAIVFFVEYMLTCAAASALIWYLQETQTGTASSWMPAARQAIEFFPSPIFAGKLMVYLTQFDTLGPLERAFMNWGITAACAMVAHVVATTAVPWTVPAPLQYTATIICEALGFGLGIAWNVLLWQWIGPSTSLQSTVGGSILYWLAFTGYLGLVFCLSFRLAASNDTTTSNHTADSNNNNNNNNTTNDATTTVWDRQHSLLSFAANVVCAFTAVEYLNAMLLRSDWMGNVQALIILFIGSGLVSGIVAQQQQQQQQQQHQQQQQTATLVDTSLPSRTSSSSLSEAVQPTCHVLALTPCTWCLCPWLPLLWCLSPASSSSHEQWFHVIALVAGLASSIKASGILTASVDGIATHVLHICSADDDNDTSHKKKSWKHASACPHPWAFVALQIIVALWTTALLLYLLGRLPRSSSSPAVTTEQTRTATTTTRSTSRKQRSNKQQPRQGSGSNRHGENQPLLQTERQARPSRSSDGQV